MVKKPEVLHKPRHIVCEGETDKEFFRLLLSAHGLSERFQIHAAEGKDDIAGVVASLLGARGGAEVRTILVATDSDGDPARRVAEVHKQIRASCGDALVPPAEPLHFSDGVPSLGILLIPWVDRPGCLETLLYEIAFQPSQAADVRACVETFSACVGASAWDVPKQAKLRWYVLVAGVNEQDPGRATRYLLRGRPDAFDFQHPSLDALVQFLASVP